MVCIGNARKLPGSLNYNMFGIHPGKDRQYPVPETFKTGHKFIRKKYEIILDNIQFVLSSDIRGEMNSNNLFSVEIERESYIGEVVDYQLRIKSWSIRAKSAVSNKMTKGEMVKIYLDPDKMPILSE